MVRARFAPSPTGFLHVGNVRTALYNWLFARQKKGTFVLRIEDTDAERSALEYERHIISDLRCLGLDWDEGPDCGGAFGPYRQTERFALYRRYADQLLEQEHAYYCFCTEEELDSERELQFASGGQPRYSGKCRALAPAEARRRKSAGEAATVRLKVRPGKVGFQDLVFGPIEVDCSVIGDPILLRSDGSPNYNFAVVVDDAMMEITHVIRGEGHISNTHRQILLYQSLDWKLPEFAHLSTILGSDGAKLSKRHGATSVAEFRQQGFLPEALVNYLALLGWSPPQEGQEILTLGQMVELFSLDRVSRSPAIFDPDKLKWVNRSHLKLRSVAELAELARPVLIEARRIPDAADPLQTADIRQFMEMLVGATLNHLDTMSQIVAESRLVFEFPVSNLGRDGALGGSVTPEAVKVIESLYRQVEPLQDLDLEQYRLAVGAVKAETGQKGKNLFHPIRIALTAEHSGPELDKLIPLLELGKKLNLPSPILGCKDRLRLALDTLRGGG